MPVRPVSIFVAVVLIGALIHPAIGHAASRGINVTLKASEAQGAPDAGTVRLYGSSHALVIGIDDYTGGWPDLSNAVKDAKLVAKELERKGFEVSLRTNLTSSRMEKAFKEFFILKGEDPNARLFVWYAGHGHTMGGEGFLVPADAPRPNVGARFRFSALSMRRFGEYVRLAQSKHAFAVFDSCFAGTVFNSQRSTPPPAITRATTLPVRQFLTSGDAEQKVSDDGMFRKLFVRALKGEERADANGDGYVTASEVGMFLGDRMTNLTRSRQTPRYGKLNDEDFDRGDFVFVLPGRAVASRPATIAPTAPGGGGFSLDDLRKQQRVQAGWERWQQAMGAAFSEAATFDGETGLRRTAWDRFLSAYKEDNPFSEEDERLRDQARRRKAAVKEKAEEALVAAVQQELAAHGYKPGAVDGRLGANTKAAIENFQRRQGQAVDGRATETLLALLRRQPPSPPPPREPAVGTVFRDCEGARVAMAGVSPAPGIFCGPEMVVIPAGSFRMGSSPAERRWAVKQGAKQEWVDWETPRKNVRIGYKFAVGKSEVTKGQYGTFVRDTDHDTGGGCYVWDNGKWNKEASKSWRDPGYSQQDNHPAVCVSWDDAKAYVRWLSRKTGQTYRLLSESEWEYTARAGTETVRYWGHDWENKEGCKYANVAGKYFSEGFDCGDGYKFTSPAKKYRANRFGLHDMLGNVWEWTEDCWHNSYNGAPANGSAWTTGGNCRLRVLRGGSWYYLPWFLRSAFRLWLSTVSLVDVEDPGFDCPL